MFLQDNVLVGENSTAVLSDFGIAKTIVTKTTKATNARTIGSPAYMYVSCLSCLPVAEQPQSYRADRLRF